MAGLMAESSRPPSSSPAMIGSSWVIRRCPCPRAAGTRIVGFPLGGWPGAVKRHESLGGPARRGTGVIPSGQLAFLALDQMSSKQMFDRFVAFLVGRLVDPHPPLGVGRDLEIAGALDLDDIVDRPFLGRRCGRSGE